METALQPGDRRIRIGLRRSLALIRPYIWKRLKAQIAATWLIIVYLILFQTLVLRLPVNDAAVIAAGLALAIAGLTLFIEGLFLGLMPLGEQIGLRLPRKSKLPVVLLFAVIFGAGAAFAEPAINILRMAGSSVQAWEAPLLFLLLNKHADYLVYAIALGAGIAVAAGMIRFVYAVSLKPFIYVLVAALTGLTAWAFFDPNLRTVTGIAWDCGVVTTGPVTVPLVLALGIGISRVLSGPASGAGSGFGVVTLASLLPVLAVFILALSFASSVPRPMEEERFFSIEQRSAIQHLFDSPDALLSYAYRHAGEHSQMLLYGGGETEMLEDLRSLVGDEIRRTELFGTDEGAFYRWVVDRGSEAQQRAVFGSDEAIREAAATYALMEDSPFQLRDMARSSFFASARAILPLTAFLLAVFVLIVREKLPRSDEIVLGIGLAFLGMALLIVGLELGLGKLGNQVGGKLPALYTTIALEDERTTIIDFDPETVQTAITPEGDRKSFFFLKTDEGVRTIPYYPDRYDETTGRYTVTPERGPLFPGRHGLAGLVVLLVFAFIMGYGATLAEPALKAFAVTVEDVTVGTLKKSLLMQAIAAGVGTGIALGVARLVWEIPLAWIVLPLYILLVPLTYLSSEEYVTIGWDSAGVTTGPVTVPLVLAMGLGIGSQVGGVEGFGVLAAAAVCPIVSVLLVGLAVNRKRATALRSAGEEEGVVPL